MGVEMTERQLPWRGLGAGLGRQDDAFDFEMRSEITLGSEREKAVRSLSGDL